MNEIRCPMCKRLWFYGEGEFKIGIKCPKCSHVLSKQIVSDKNGVKMENYTP